MSRETLIAAWTAESRLWKWAKTREIAAKPKPKPRPGKPKPGC